MNRLQLRLLVARALRQLHDPLLVADSPLVRIPGIEARSDPAAAGEALGDRLREASQRVMARLAGGRRADAPRTPARRHARPGAEADR